jgi:hypothetical protein
MKLRTLLASLAVFLPVVALGSGLDGNIGTWKLNESKSTLGAAKNHTVVYAMAGDDLKVTVDGVDKDGKPIHNEWTGKVDGKDYPVTGDANGDTRSYRWLDERTLEFTGKKGGPPNMTGKVALSADGKVRTVTTTATDAKGKKVENTAVYDKQ